LTPIVETAKADATVGSLGEAVAFCKRSAQRPVSADGAATAPLTAAIA
jgi:hypothetical protein